MFLHNHEKAFRLLPDVGLEDRYVLFKLGVLRGFDVSSTTFRSHAYLNVSIPISTTFNTITVPQDQRVTNLIRDSILPEAKALLPSVSGKAIDGIAFHLLIPAHNFVTGDEAKFDELLVYLNTDELRKFAASGITSQKLIDNSFVLLNGDRIEAKS